MTVAETLEQIRTEIGATRAEFSTMSAIEVAERRLHRHRFVVEVDIDPGWISYVAQSRSIFDRQFFGAWALPFAIDEVSQLVYDVESGPALDEDDLELARELFRAGKPLPLHWYRLDRAAALRAWECGVKRWGVDWRHHSDAAKENVVLQLALLGEVLYG